MLVDNSSFDFNVESILSVAGPHYPTDTIGTVSRAYENIGITNMAETNENIKRKVPVYSCEDTVLCGPLFSLDRPLLCVCLVAQTEYLIK